MIDLDVMLGRPRLDIVPDAKYLEGSRVLVTGAGGSIGSALCRRLALCGVAELLMLDRDESALHAVQLSIRGRALFDDGTVVLGDIRDASWIKNVIIGAAPQIVFHAAALKHQPLLEQYPGEALKTNVLGTLHVLSACSRANVELMIHLSTDKAADPTCVLGASKRVAERLVSGYWPHRFLSVRLGNVFGSRGSIADTFSRQIRQGLPVTVTSPEMRRYFLAMDEAVDLLIHAGSIGNHGEVLVPDMGEPILIAELARRIGEHLGSPVEIVYTGVRPGEKETEVTMGVREAGMCLEHPLIQHVMVPALSRHTTIDRKALDDLGQARTILFRLVEERR